MNREIKFRAWDIDNKKYEYDIAIRPINRIIGLEIFNNDMYPVEFRGIVEQYTGLTDKNGKEIYEGDIVRQVGGNLLCPVEFKYGGFVPFTSDMMSFDNDYCEVIGNIHENPELLEEAK